MMPKGLDVGISAPQGNPSQANSVQLTLSSQEWPMLELEGRQILLQDLQAALRERFKDRSGNVVIVMKDGAPSFWEVVSVTDTCRSAGAKVSLDRKL